MAIFKTGFFLLTVVVAISILFYLSYMSSVPMPIYNVRTCLPGESSDRGISRADSVTSRVAGVAAARAPTVAPPPPPPPPPPPHTNNDTQVLVVAYYRSGSSLTAALLNEVVGSFYVFEPLHPLLHDMGSRTPFVHLNASLPTEAPVVEGYEIPYVKQTFDSIYQCDLGNAHRKIPLIFSNGERFGPYRACIKRNGVKNDTCLKRLNTFCNEKPFKVIKTIRISMQTAQYFLDMYPKLKVIHVIRDPRGMMCSLGCGSPDDWRRRCAAAGYDIKTRLKLQQLYPGRLMELLYEDFAHFPLETAERVLHFVGKEFTDEIQAWVRDNMMSNKARKGVLDVAQPNSTVAAYSWVKRIKKSHIDIANKECTSLIRYGHFVSVQTIDDLAKFTIPHRQKYRGRTDTLPSL